MTMNHPAVSRTFALSLCFSSFVVFLVLAHLTEVGRFLVPYFWLLPTPLYTRVQALLPLSAFLIIKELVRTCLNGSD